MSRFILGNCVRIMAGLAPESYGQVNQDIKLLKQLTGI